MKNIETIANSMGKRYANKFAKWADTNFPNAIEWRTNGVIVLENDAMVLKAPANTDAPLKFWRTYTIPIP